MTDRLVRIAKETGWIPPEKVANRQGVFVMAGPDGSVTIILKPECRELKVVNGKSLAAVLSMAEGVLGLTTDPED